MAKRIGFRKHFGYSRVVYLTKFTALIQIDYLTLVTAGVSQGLLDLYDLKPHARSDRNELSRKEARSIAIDFAFLDLI